MSILSWNCRGLGSDWTVQELLGLVSSQQPSFVFLMETKATTSQVERIRVRMGFEGRLCVERNGRGGGLAVLWRDATMATLINYSTNHIDVCVKLPGIPEWRLTCFYGNSDQNRRQESWDLLRELRDQSSLPWVTIGDFNDITCQSEKRGPHPQPTALIEGFNDSLMDCQLFDLGMEGSRFTWEKGRGTEAWVEERLDRAVATPSWLDIYETAVVRNLLTLESDHTAILLDVDTGAVRRAKKRFRFESAWLQEEGCHRVVDQVWNLTHGMDFQSRSWSVGAIWDDG
ncbi:PREDICTED: uncharacterized protein LOC109154706 [Ipomoea nil]|uniref:uncharacterized protein LOC109154706 n=1 Tax=Ipomoea nil TaxID=35883 RepID=UPI000900E0A0|nr:PREDICTED: uncharacterized protein LOC109154706 [Ipomoea nil]